MNPSSKTSSLLSCSFFFPAFSYQPSGSWIMMHKTLQIDKNNKPKVSCLFWTLTWPFIPCLSLPSPSPSSHPCTTTSRINQTNRITKNLSRKRKKKDLQKIHNRIDIYRDGKYHLFHEAKSSRLPGNPNVA